MKLIPITALAIVAAFFLAPAAAQVTTPKVPEQGVPSPVSVGIMDHTKMMADMKSADARLEGLAQTMKSASGDAKVLAIQELLTALVQNQADMHRHMTMMHDHMMSQTSTHPHK